MAMIGLFSDSAGDLGAFDAALKLLSARGAKRFLFAGGRFDDLDEWVRWKREEVRAQSDYGNADFLEDVTRHLLGKEPLARPPAFGNAWEQGCAIEDLSRLKDCVIRAPERGCLAWNDRAIPKKGLDLLGDVVCCVVHDKNDLEKEDMVNAPVLVHGNAPEPRVVQIGPRVFVTPGRLIGGRTATVGLLELSERQVCFSAFALDGTVVIDRQPLLHGAKLKLSVK